MFKRKPKALTPEELEVVHTKDFFDMILPGTVKFLSDHYIVGDSYRCVWVIREYPPSTEEQAILSQLADRNGVTIRIYHRLVEAMEQRKIIQNATRRNRLKSGGNDVNETIEAEGNLQDVIELLANLRKNKEPLLHCSVFMELKARNMDALKELQSEIAMDVLGSFVWKQLDGKRDMHEVAELVKQEFGKKADPVYERLKFVEIMRDNKFVLLKEERKDV